MHLKLIFPKNSEYSPVSFGRKRMRFFKIIIVFLKEVKMFFGSMGPYKKLISHVNTYI